MVIVQSAQCRLLLTHIFACLLTKNSVTYSTHETEIPFCTMNICGKLIVESFKWTDSHCHFLVAHIPQSTAKRCRNPQINFWLSTSFCRRKKMAMGIRPLRMLRRKVDVVGIFFRYTRQKVHFPDRPSSRLVRPMGSSGVGGFRTLGSWSGWE